jgi:hypothetical protein
MNADYRRQRLDALMAVLATEHKPERASLRGIAAVGIPVRRVPKRTPAAASGTGRDEKEG